MSRSIPVFAAAAIIAAAIACGKQSAAPTSPTAAPGNANEAAGADGSTLKVTAPTPQSPVSDQQVNDGPTLSASASSPKFGGTLPVQYRFEVFNSGGAKVVDSGLVGTPSYRVTAQLPFRARHTWRVRAEYEGNVGPWSATASFVSPEGGYIRGNTVFDPLYNGTTVGQVIGPVTFVPNTGARLESNQSYVRYVIPQTLTAGEFSVEVRGLRANAPGDKSKVFGMQQGTGDYITDPYRVDIQYRGTAGFPPNAITFRAIYGDADDLDVRYEPPTGVRLGSAIALDPNTTYYWRATWGREFRLTVQTGGWNGPMIYNYGVASPNGIYNPQPHYAFVGTPSGRSGVESASIPGATYSNVYIGPGPRP